MENVLITGGTGLIGSALTALLEKEGYNVRILSRNPRTKNQFKWNLKDQYIDDKAFENLHHIIHLAGAGIADKRWTPKRKQVIIDSRVNSVELLFSKTESSQIDLKTFVSASGIGYYGAVTSDHIFIETDEAENDFLGQVCKVWEEAVLQFESINIPTTILRTGIVLSANGGAIEKMKTPIVSPLGSGHQYMPWIHIDDLCQLYLSAIQGKIKGIYNAVAPEYQTNKSFSKKLSKSLGRPYIPFGVPAFGLKTIFGELAIIPLTGSRISCEKLINDGFEFKYPKLSEAFENLFKK